MSRKSNKTLADNVTITGTQYLPGGTAYFTNSWYDEVIWFFKRVSEAGSGTLTVTIEEYDPGTEEWFAVLGGGGSAVGPLAWAADETDAANARQALRMGSGILGGDADGVLVVNTEDTWVDYPPPRYYRFKCVEAGTSSVLTVSAHYSRGGSM
jgi:hypothetical protein